MAETLRQVFNGSATTLADAASIGPTFTCTRAGDTATVVNSSGNIEDVAANLPRFDHVLSDGTRIGLLSELTRSNIALWTEDNSNAVWVKSNITVDVGARTSPRGTSNSNMRLVASAANGTMLQTVTAASADYAFPVFLKRAVGTGNIELTVDGGSTWTAVSIDGTWQRYSITQDAVTNPQLGVRIVTSGDEIDFFGPQLESGSSGVLGVAPTSYIPNNSATASVTRNGDVISTSDTTWASAAGVGTYYVRAAQPYIDSSVENFAIALQQGGGTTSWGTIGRNGGGNTKAVYAAFQGIILSPGTPMSNGVMNRHVTAADTNDFVYYLDGSLQGTDTSLALDTDRTKFNIGSQTNDSQQWNGHIAEVRYYDERLDNATLLAMSNGIFPSEPSGSPNPGLSFGKMGRMGSR